MLDGNPPLPAVALKLLLQMLRTNPSIVSITMGKAETDSPSLRKLIDRQLGVNASKVNYDVTQRNEKRMRTQLRKQLIHDRRLREWTWFQYSSRLRIEERWSIKKTVIEEEYRRSVLQLQCEMERERHFIWKNSDCSRMEEARQLIEKKLSDRTKYIDDEDPPRMEIYKFQEKAWLLLNKKRYEDRRRTDGLIKERMRRERGMREDLSLMEKTQRTNLRDLETETFKQDLKQFKITYSKFEADWKARLYEAAELQRRTREEQAKLAKEEEARLSRLERWEEQKRKDQNSLYKKENSSRFALGNEAQDERKDMIRLEKQTITKTLQSEKEGNARRDRSLCNWQSPTIRLSGTETSKSYIGTVLPCRCLDSLSIHLDIPVPLHLSQGVMFPDDTETTDDWIARKSSVIEGKITVFLSPSTYYHPLSEIDFQSDFETDDGNFYIKQDNLYYGSEQIGRIAKRLTPRQLWLLEGGDTEECPAGVATDQSCCGMEVEMQTHDIALFQLVVRRVCVSCEKQTPLQEKLPLVVKLDISFSAPVVGESDNREYPSSLVGGKVPSSLSAEYGVGVFISPFTIPANNQRFSFKEGTNDLRFLKGISVRELPETVRIQIKQPGCLDKLGLRQPSFIRDDIIKSEGKVVGNVIERTGCVIQFQVNSGTRSNVTTKLLEGLLENILFENTSQDPEPMERCAELTFSMSCGSNARTATLIDVVPEDDPTVIEFSTLSMAYRRISGPLAEGLDVPIPPQHPLDFASSCSVTDVDTTSFSTGYLLVITATSTRGDNILLSPPQKSHITVDGSLVLHKNQRLGWVTEAPGSHPEGIQIIFSEEDISTINRVDALMKCLVFSAECSKESVRIVEVTLKIDDCDPVCASCRINVTGPLIQIPPTFQSITYREQSGPMRVAPFEVLVDDGWDGGFIHAEIIEGATPDDVLRITQGEVTIVDHLPGIVLLLFISSALLC